MRIFRAGDLIKGSTANYIPEGRLGIVLCNSFKYGPENCTTYIVLVDDVLGPRFKDGVLPTDMILLQSSAW